VSRLRSLSSSQRHRLAFLSRSKSRTHRLDGDRRTYDDLDLTKVLDSGIPVQSPMFG
jgi:hypothetical protein